MHIFTVQSEESVVTLVPRLDGSLSKYWLGSRSDFQCGLFSCLKIILSLKILLKQKEMNKKGFQRNLSVLIDLYIMHRKVIEYGFIIKYSKAFGDLKDKTSP